MSNQDIPKDNEDEGGGLSGVAQQIIGEVERIGAILTGDPISEAEAEFNIEVGEIREDAENAVDETDEEE